MNEDKLDAQESTQPENNQVENTPIENVQIEPALVETVQVEETQENTPVADSTVYDQARADDATYNNDAPVAGAIRINKFLASCGVESRRAADKLIEEGRVEVNGKVVEAPGIRVTTEDFVKLDGHRMTPKEEVVVLLNKPRGYVCSRDAQGAEGTVFDLMPPRLQHLNYVGRLDADSEGLIVMTNKGDFAQTLSHPTEGIEKEYWVTVDQNFDNSVLMQFLKGVRIPEGQAKAKYVCRSSARRACIVLEQGLKRQVRQMFACLGLRVRKLVRVRIGSLWGGELAEGSWRLMDAQDMELASHNPKQPKKYLGARELAGYKGTSTRLASNKPTSGVEDDESYEFNPADFEGVDFDADTCELTPDMKTIFSEAVETEKDYSQIDENAERQFSDVRRERSFGGRPTEGGDREGGFRERREGGFGGPRREGGFGERREGGFGGPRREGGFGGPRREGGGFGERREGGFGGPRREGG
ncbi:MAG: pseudouridine synthase, partial [Akkermansia sp.]